MSNDRNVTRAEIAAASAASGARASEEGLNDAYEPISAAATVETVAILDVAAVRAMVAEFQAGKRAEPRFVVIPKYAPKGTTGWVYTVTQVNRSTVSLTPLGGGRGLKADPFTLAEPSDGDVAAHTARVAAAASVPDDGLCTGSIVRLFGPRWNQDPDALWTVTALKGMTEIAVVRLGGDGGRTWPKIPRTLVSVIIAPGELRAAMNNDPLFRDL